MSLKICVECNSLSTMAYRVPLDIWRLVVKEKENHSAFLTTNKTLCYKCFIKLADEINAPWKEFIELYPLDNEGNIL